MKTIHLFLFATLHIFLIGCSGGGGSTSTNSTSSTTVSGQLIDSYLENVNYSCPDGSTGLTDIEGKFQCNAFPVTFKLGNLTLGSITNLASDSHVFPQDLLQITRNDINNTDVIAMARFLQSCDSDNNTSNGIQVSDELKISLDSYPENFDSSKITEYAAAVNVSLISEEISQAHLIQSLQTLNNKELITGIPTTISQELRNTLSYMGNEERLAYDVYNKLYTYFPTLTQLTTIATRSESQHILAVQALINKYVTDYNQFTNTDLSELEYKDTQVEDMQAGVYDIQAIQDLYDTLIAKGDDSNIDALEVACIIEVTDINDLDADILLAQSENATDIITTFNFLRDGSYSHYWSFDGALKNLGVTDGCCSLGTDYCHPEYPQNSNARR